MKSGLWAWAEAAWARPGVERACLDLQNLGGQSVALLLWRAWRVAEGLPAERALCESAAALVRPVETNILRPLRVARHELATAWSEIVGRDDVYAQVRAAELALERAILETLEQLPTESASDPDTDTASALVSLMEIWSGSAPDAEARALGTMLALALT